MLHNVMDLTVHHRVCIVLIIYKCAYLFSSLSIFLSLCVYCTCPPPGADFSLRDLGFGDPLPPHVASYRDDLGLGSGGGLGMGLPHRDYSVSMCSDADTEPDGVMSPEHAVRLWGRNTKSGRSSCLSSRANSNLTLTDTEHENTENGRELKLSTLCYRITTFVSLALLLYVSCCFTYLLDVWGMDVLLNMKAQRMVRLLHL